MPVVGQGIRNLPFYLLVKRVTLNGSGANTSGTEAWPTAFDSVPVTAIIPPQATATDGTWELQSVTASGFTWNISGQSALANQTVEVGVFAHQKL